jgi:hypothetical protein
MKITRLLPVLLAFATGAFAQSTPADPAKLALAHEVIGAMNADKMFNGMAAQMKQMTSQMTTPPADATPEQRQKAAQLQDKIMDLTMAAAKGMIAKMDQVYADVYSEAELKAMKAFFTSPEGQSMIAKQPQIMAHIMPLVQEMQRDLVPKIQQLVEDSKAAQPSVPAPLAPPAK